MPNLLAKRLSHVESEPCAGSPGDMAEDQLVQWAQCLLEGGKRKQQQDKLLGPILNFMHNYDRQTFDTLPEELRKQLNQVVPKLVPEKAKEEKDKQVRVNATPEKYRVLWFNYFVKTHVVVRSNPCTGESSQSMNLCQSIHT